MNALKQKLKIVRRWILSSSRLQLDSEHFSIHKTSSIEIAHGSRLRFSGTFNIQKFVTLYIDEGAEATFGDGIYIGDFSVIRATRTQLTVGSHTIIGQGVKLIATNHAYQRRSVLIKNQDIDIAKIGIHIGCDNWLGAGCVILPGVVLGNGVVVGANAVVTRSVPDYAVVVGNPAKVLKFRN